MELPRPRPQVRCVPTQTANTIIEKVHQYAPLLDKITLLRVPGNVTYAVESEQADAAYHTRTPRLPQRRTGLTSISLSGVLRSSSSYRFPSL